MITKINLKGEQSKVCKKKIFLIFKIPITSYPLPKKNISENFLHTEISRIRFRYIFCSNGVNWWKVAESNMLSTPNACISP